MLILFFHVEILPAHVGVISTTEDNNTFLLAPVKECGNHAEGHEYAPAAFQNFY